MYSAIECVYTENKLGSARIGMERSSLPFVIGQGAQGDFSIDRMGGRH